MTDKEWADLVQWFVARDLEPCTVGVIALVQQAELVYSVLGGSWRQMNLDHREGDTWSPRWGNIEWLEMHAGAEVGNAHTRIGLGDVFVFQGWRLDGTGHTGLSRLSSDGFTIATLHTSEGTGPRLHTATDRTQALMAFFRFSELRIALWRAKLPHPLRRYDRSWVQAHQVRAKIDAILGVPTTTPPEFIMPSQNPIVRRLERAGYTPEMIAAIRQNTEDDKPTKPNALETLQKIGEFAEPSEVLSLLEVAAEALADGFQPGDILTIGAALVALLRR